MKTLIKITEHPIYIFFIIFIILPMNGAIIGRGDIILGIFLILLQVPWFVSVVLLKLFASPEETL